MQVYTVEPGRNNPTQITVDAEDSDDKMTVITMLKYTQDSNVPTNSNGYIHILEVQHHGKINKNTLRHKGEC